MFMNNNYSRIILGILGITLNIIIQISIFIIDRYSVKDTSNVSLEHNKDDQ